MSTHKSLTNVHHTSPFSYTSNEHAAPLFWTKYLAYVDTQKPYSMGWWLLSLMLHGCILVPLTFLLVYSLNGPTLTFLGISMSLFFINVIANMGGAPFRFTFSSFLVSLALHAAMVLSVLL